MKKPLALLSLIVHLLAFVQFHTSPAPADIYEGFLWQFHLLLTLSFAASLILYYSSRNTLALLLFRLLAVLLIAYPTGHYVWIGTLLMMGLVWDAALLLPLPWGRLLSLAMLIPLVLFSAAAPPSICPWTGP